MHGLSIKLCHFIVSTQMYRRNNEKQRRRGGNNKNIYYLRMRRMGNVKNVLLTLRWTSRLISRDIIIHASKGGGCKMDVLINSTSH